MAPSLDQLNTLIRQMDAPHACSVKMCTWALDWMRAQLEVGSRSALHTVPASLTGVDIYVNDEIPPDRMVFYDQHGEVFHVQMIDMDAVLAYNLTHPKATP